MSTDAPQYQHFILKNFDHPFNCPKAPTNGSKCKKHHHEKGKYPGGRTVNCLELLPEVYKIEEQSVRRVCGMDDMYTDQSPSCVSSSGFFQTYNCISIDNYKKDDRDLLKEYMDRNGIQRPSTVYYGFFCHFREHITEFWMSLCTPSNADEEFILSDTGSHVYEGLTVDFQDKATGKFLRLGPRFHLFAPISPRLIIALRSKHLPEPHEDNNPEIKAQRQLFRQIEIDSIYGPGTKSILEDLPVHKAIKSSFTLFNGRLRPQPGWDGQLRQTDSFSFPFFRISTNHTRIMNGLLLDHAFHGLTIIFNQKAPFLDLLEWFLTEPCEVGKRLGGEYRPEQMRYLARLAALMYAEGHNISLNITTKPTYYDLDVESYKNQNNDAARWLEGLEKNHAIGEEVEGNREKDPDTKADAYQQGLPDAQDQPKTEKNSLAELPLGPMVEHEEELSQAELTSPHLSELSAHHPNYTVSLSGGLYDCIPGSVVGKAFAGLAWHQLASE
ncbi:hypothetical protein FGADI_1699 [Fusarium gaditjirri]|uniref:Uncharacterized protein n=1 Tax=Fusarium gaditjirri TaxID=282569 RepID=A0A8H4X2D0_9HYPO|nr:hypothetical protein FGADI_1699 [Fusarium gaditjirri]